MRSSFRRTLLACLALCASSPAFAQALPTAVHTDQCALRIDTTTVNWIIRGYDPFSSNQPTGSFDALFINEGDQDCSFYPVFEADRSPFGLRSDLGSPVPYTLIDETDGYDATPLGGRTLRRVNHRAVTVPARSQQMVRYILNVDPDRLPGDGLFSQTLVLQAEQFSGAVLAQRQMSVGIEVQPSAVMSLAGAFTRARGQADVDLGELSEGLARVPLNLNVRSTRAFRLEVESQNNGKLRLGGTDWSIPYQILIDGRPTGASERAFVSDNRPGRQLATLPISFLIGDARQKRAGVYSDVVTISVALD